MHKAVMYVLTSLLLCSALGWNIMPVVLEAQEGEVFEESLLIPAIGDELPFERDQTHHFESTLKSQAGHPDKRVGLLGKPLLI
jgi:hypothetical protein